MIDNKETFSTDGMVCPHCQHLNKPEEEHHYDQDVNEQWCDNCDENFETSCYISYSWTSNVIDKEEG